MYCLWDYLRTCYFSCLSNLEWKQRSSFKRFFILELSSSHMFISFSLGVFSCFFSWFFLALNGKSTNTFSSYSIFHQNAWYLQLISHHQSLHSFLAVHIWSSLSLIWLEMEKLRRNSFLKAKNGKTYFKPLMKIDLLN